MEKVLDLLAELVVVSQTFDKMNFGYKDGKLINVSAAIPTVKHELSLFTADERTQLLLACSLQPVKLSEKTAAYMETVKAQKTQGLLIGLLMGMGVRLTSKRVQDICYTTEVKSTPAGTHTKVKRQEHALSYSWATEMKMRLKPERVVATMVASTFVPTSDGAMAPAQFSKSKELTKYHPSVNPFGSFASLGKECTTEDALTMKLEKEMEDTPDFYQACSEQLVLMAPPIMKGNGDTKVRVQEVDGVNRFIKAGPTKAVLKGATFEDVVVQIGKMAPSIGSAKTGFGRMSNSHYDGNMSIPKSVRDKQEFLDDYLPKDVDVYVLDVSDASLVCAMSRVIESHRTSGDDYVVVYKGSEIDPSYRTAFAIGEDGSIEGVASKAIVKLPVVMWPKFQHLTTYFIANNPIKLGSGAKNTYFSKSREAREPYIEAVKGYTHYAYYGFIGAAAEGEEVQISVGGRKGKVIFSSFSGYTRLEAANIVFQMVRHSLLFPWLRTCYLFTREGNYVMPGARPIAGCYDFRPPNKDTFHSSLDEEAVVSEYIGGALEDLFRKKKSEEMVKKVQPVVPKIPSQVHTPSPVSFFAQLESGEEEEEVEGFDVLDESV